jgi:hypothetical protein
MENEDGALLASDPSAEKEHDRNELTVMSTSVFCNELHFQMCNHRQLLDVAVSRIVNCLHWIQQQQFNFLKVDISFGKQMFRINNQASLFELYITTTLAFVLKSLAVQLIFSALSSSWSLTVVLLRMESS